MAVGKERIAGGLAMQTIGDRVFIAPGPIENSGRCNRGLIQDMPHFELRVRDVDAFCEKLQQCAEEG